VLKEETNKIECYCKSQEPVTVVNDIEGLFVNSRLGSVFSEEGLDAFLNV
jgi:hypothetical protein